MVPAGGRQPPPPHGIPTSYPHMLVTWPYKIIIEQPSKSHMLYIRASHVLPTVTPFINQFTFCNLLLPIQYLCSSHILVSVKISYAIHTCWPRTMYALPT